eukprot:m51a1_g10003 hypothetical protein (1545) ;mRNA; f:80223-85610
MIPDPATGRPYYFNPVTRETSWNPPVAEPPLPPGWQKAMDPRTGRVFYIDHNTRQTSWTPPSFAPPPAAVPSLQQPPPQASMPPMSPASPAVPSGPSVSMYQQPSAPAADAQHPQQQLQQQPLTQQQPTAPPQWGSTSFYGAQAQNPYGSSWGPYAPYAGASGIMMPAPGGAIGMPQPVAPVAPMQQQQHTSLSASRPTWTLPANETHCCSCGTQFGTFTRRKTQCRCCTREFCDTCVSKKANVSPQEQQARVCHSCHAHLSRGSVRCVSRLVPYLSDPRDDQRQQALAEINELLAQEAAIMTGEDVRTCGLARELRALVGTLTPATAPAASALLKACTAWPLAVDSIAADPAACAKQLIEGLELLLGQPTGRTVADVATVAALAARQSLPARQEMIKARALRVARKALESADTSVQHAAAQLIEALSAGDTTCGEPDDEGAAVLSLVAILESNPEGTIASTVITALTNLCFREGNRLALKEAGGIQGIFKTLESQDATARKSSLTALSRLCSQVELCPEIARSVGAVAVLVTAETSTPDMKKLALGILATLSQSDASQRIVNEALLLDHIAVIAAALSSGDPELQKIAIDVLASTFQTHNEIVRGVIQEAHLVEPLTAIVNARNVASLMALRVVAMSTQATKENAEAALQHGILKAVMDHLTAAVEPAATEAANALWCLCAAPAVTTALLQIPNAVGLIGALLTSPNAALRAASCGIISTTGFAIAPRLIRESPALPVLLGIANSHQADPEGSVNALRAIAAMCDGPETDEGSEWVRATMVSQNVHKLACSLLRGTPPPLQYQAVSLCASLARSATARPLMDLAAILAAAGSQDQHIRSRACVAVCRFAADEASIAALKRARALPVLVEMLFSSEATMREFGSRSIARIAEISDPGASEFQELQQLGAVLALLPLTADPEAAVSAAACQAVNAMITRSETCLSTALSEKAPSAAASVLRVRGSSSEVLAFVQAVTRIDLGAREFVDAGGAAELAKLAAGGDATVVAAIAALAKVCPRSWDAVMQTAGPAGLVTLVSAANDEVRRLAVASLCSLAQQSPEELAKAGAMRALAAVVAAAQPDSLAVEPAAWACAEMCAVPDAVREVVAAGATEAFVKLLASASPKLRGYAMRVVSQLAALGDAEFQAVVGAGAIAHFVRALAAPDSPDFAAVVGVVERLSATPEGAAAVGEQDGVPAVVQLLHSQAYAVQAVGVLTRLSAVASARAQIVSNDAFYEALAPLLSGADDKASQAASALVALLAGERAFAERFATLPATSDAFVAMLRSPAPAVDTLALAATALAVPRSRRALVERGCIEPLVDLGTSDSPCAARALEALAHAVCDDSARRAFPATAAASVAALVTEDRAADPAFTSAVKLLGSLMVSESHRKAIVENEETVKQLCIGARRGVVPCVYALIPVIAAATPASRDAFADVADSVVAALASPAPETAPGLADAASQLLLAAVPCGEPVALAVRNNCAALACAAATLGAAASQNVLRVLAFYMYSDDVRGALEGVLPDMLGAEATAAREDVRSMAACLGIDA